jgi:hypothetical protein
MALMRRKHRAALAAARDAKALAMLDDSKKSFLKSGATLTLEF